MTLKSILSTAILITLAHTAAFSQGRPATNIPHLEKRGTATQLIVDGKPFLVSKTGQIEVKRVNFGKPDTARTAARTVPVSCSDTPLK